MVDSGRVRSTSVFSKSCLVEAEPNWAAFGRCRTIFGKQPVPTSATLGPKFPQIRLGLKQIWATSAGAGSISRKSGSENWHGLVPKLLLTNVAWWLPYAHHPGLTRKRTRANAHTPRTHATSSTPHGDIASEFAAGTCFAGSLADRRCMALFIGRRRSSRGGMSVSRDGNPLATATKPRARPGDYPKPRHAPASMHYFY